jgi:hypothetical protein
MSGNLNLVDPARAAEVAAWAAETGDWLAERLEKGRARRTRPQPIENFVCHAGELDNLLAGLRVVAAALGVQAPARMPTSATPAAPTARALPPGWRLVK